MQTITITLGGPVTTVPVKVTDASGNVTAPPVVPIAYTDVSDDGSTGQFNDVISLALTPGNTDGTSIDLTAVAVGHQRVHGVSGSLSADLMVYVSGPAANMNYVV